MTYKQASEAKRSRFKKGESGANTMVREPLATTRLRSSRGKSADKRPGPRRLQADKVKQVGRTPLMTYGQQAYSLLEHRIVTLKIAPGTLISDITLSRELEIGRTPVREALQRLAHEMLVEIEPRRATRISDLDVARQLQVMELQRPLEFALSDLARRKATSIQREGLRAIAAKILQAGLSANNEKYMHVNRLAYGELMESTHNRYFPLVFSPLHSVSHRFWFAFHREYASIEHSAHLHAARLRAVASGDMQEVHRATKELVDYFKEFAMRVLMGDSTQSEKTDAYV